MPSFTKPQASEVTSIFDTSLDVSIVRAFIDDAYALVDELLGSSGLSTDRLRRITKYLAAGFAELRDPRASKDSAGGTSVSYMQRSYVDQAIALDTTGALRSHFGSDAAAAKVQFRSVTRAGPQTTEATVAD